MKTTCSKVFEPIPFAHRQPEHKGHCRLIHGHNWLVMFRFKAESTDINGFIVDFGGEAIHRIRDWMKEEFDHALVLNHDDPLASVESLTKFAKIVKVPDCSCEGLAEYFLEAAQDELDADEDCFSRQVRIVSCTVKESHGNSATATAEA